MNDCLEQWMKGPLPTSQSSHHNSEEILALKQSQSSEIDLNDDRCFRCQGKGELYCCDSCYRAYHRNCIATRRFSHTWYCQYCSKTNLCVTCGQSQKSKETCYICTLCFRFSHSNCSNIPQKIIHSQSFFFEGSRNFVCSHCLTQFGFKKVLKCKRVYVGSEDKLFYFVQIKVRSPIHCGWFQEEQLRSNRFLRQDFTQAEVIECPTIDRVINMRLPHDLKGDPQDALNELLIYGSRKGNYGSINNFYFLVVWDGGSASKATWQDQEVLVSAKQQLIKYLLFRKLQAAIKNGPPLQRFQQLFHVYLPVPQIKLKNPKQIEQFQTFKQLQTETAYLLTDSPYQSIQFICNYLQDKYSKNITAPSTLLICGGETTRWARKSRQLCPHLNVVHLRGNEEEVFELKQKEMFYQLIHRPRFQLMILPAERWNLQKTYLADKVFSFQTVFFDELVPNTIIQEFKQNSSAVLFQRTVRIIDRKDNNQRPISKQTSLTASQTKQNQYCVFDLTTGQILNYDLIPKGKGLSIQQRLQHISNEDQKSYNTCNWDEVNRLVFLRFILAFGMNYQPSDQLDKLIKFQYGVFKKEDKEAVKNYTLKFLAILNNTQDCPSPYLQYYLFDLQAQSIYIRICKLARLHQAVNKFRNCQEQFPFERSPRIFESSSVVYFDNWKSQDDFLLAALIIEKGFGKWTQITQSKEWAKWASACHFQLLELKQPSSISFGEYMRRILLLSSKHARVLRVELIVKERGQQLLTLMK